MAYMSLFAESAFGPIDPTAVLLQEETVTAFLAPIPEAEGHVIVAPNRVVARADQLSESEEAALWKMVRKARQLLSEKCQPDGMSVILNDGPEAGPSVAHLQVHIIPRYVGGKQEAGVQAQPSVAMPPISTREAGGPRRWIGIDFSGDEHLWAPDCAKPGVWVATLTATEDKPHLTDVRPVQELEGDGTPFERLAALLREGAFEAAAIDAPFSVPALSVPDASHARLIRAAGALAAWDASFPAVEHLVQGICGEKSPQGTAQLRATEDLWQSRGVSVRFPLWNGPRPSAPRTLACLRLLALAARPTWPFSPVSPGCLIEAYPAAQLRTWGLPHKEYAGSGAVSIPNRHVILKGLARRVALKEHRSLLLQNDDALDAVIGCFAAMAVTEDLLAFPVVDIGTIEGWIAVHV